MKLTFSRKIKLLAFICLFTCCAGVIYQLVDENLLNYNSIIVGFPLGLFFGLLELYLLPKVEGYLRKLSFTEVLVLKTVLYTLLIFAVSILLMMVAGIMQGRRFSELLQILRSVNELVLVLYTLVVYALLVFFLQINTLLGEGVLLKFISGKYHKPREEERIFMFLDMKSSTTIAERLGHTRFYTLLDEIFHEISQPVLETKAEIYQYVGDEVVLTWEVEDGIENSNCLRVFFLFREKLLRNTDAFYNSFGILPEFKAGVHFGKVVSAQIGDLKRQVVYNGDVVNTTARIQEECNNYNRDLLVSGALMRRLHPMNSFKWEKMGNVLLRGKETEIEIFHCSPGNEKVFTSKSAGESQRFAKV